VALPCRIKDPDLKGKVGHAQKTPLKGKHFESLEEAQAYLDRWEARCADTRIHGTTKRQVAAIFAEEKPALLPLPLEPFRYYQRVVHLDSCVEVEAAYYRLPPGWIGRQVNVQGIGCSFASLIQRPVSCCANMYARNVAGIASKQRTTRSRDRCASLSYCGEPAERALRSARSATLIYSSKENLVSAAFWACSHWRRSSAQPRSRMPAPPPSKWECMSTRFVPRYLEGGPN